MPITSTNHLDFVFFGCQNIKRNISTWRDHPAYRRRLYVPSKKLSLALTSNNPDDTPFLDKVKVNLERSNFAIVELPENQADNTTLSAPDRAFAALTFAFERKGSHMVCISKTEPTPKLGTFIEEHQLSLVVTDYDLTRLYGAKGIYYVLAQTKFTIDERCPPENEPIGILNLQNPKNIGLTIGSSYIPLTPQKAKLLLSLAGGEICGNEYLDSEIRIGQSRALKKRTLMDAQISYLSTDLKNAGYPDVIKKFSRIGRRLVGLKLKVINAPNEPLTPNPQLLAENLDIK